MSDDVFEVRPIGIIRSEHTVAKNTPIQPVFAKSCSGTVEVCSEYEEGLQDLDGFSHIYLLYRFDRSSQHKLKVKPFLQDVERGVFSTRAPSRPNQIGMSIVRLIRREGTTLFVEGLDILDGTPLLDIKPYVSRFDCVQTDRNGWQEDVSDPEAERLGKRGFVS